MPMSNEHTAKTILEIAHGREDLKQAEAFDLSVLPILAEHLSQDLPIDVLERFEAILKTVLRTNLSGKVSGSAARQVAEFQKQIGLLTKYKSYAIKCASPLGYSIFLQTPNEGFSFQRHITHKTEVFHILEVMPGGYVFICDYKDWEAAYDPDSFGAWLAGKADDRYERFRYRPKPGDVVTIDTLGVVHTVVGCVLEEFATVSTDMVDRLHDQNQGREIPAHFNRNYVREELSHVSFPDSSQKVDLASDHGPTVEEIPAQEIKGGYMIPLARTSITASRYVIEEGKSSDLLRDDKNAASIYVAAGAGRVVIADDDELRQTPPPSIRVSAGDVLMIPAGINYAFLNEGSQRLVLSEQRISLDVAFL
jgi:quercetin dioxygenase-like cupin family protein